MLSSKAGFSECHIFGVRKRLRLVQLTLSFGFLFIVYCILPATLLGQSVYGGNLSPREIAKQTLPSTVSIFMDTPRSKLLTIGSGFFVTEDIVATNYHVIKGNTKGYVKVNGQTGRFRIISLVEVDKENDLALLRIEGVKVRPLALNWDNSTAIGDTIFAVGDPEGLNGTFSQGIVSSQRNLNGRSLIQITAPISHGSSGGPILNERGEVIAVAVGAISSGQALNFAIPVSLLRPLIPDVLSDLAVNRGRIALGFSFEVDPLIQRAVDFYRSGGRHEMEAALYRSGMYLRTARRIFKEEGLPENVAWLGQVESGWDPGSSGLWGLDDKKAAKIGLRKTEFVDERKNVEEATRFVAVYLKSLANRYHGNWELAMAAYSLGEDKIDIAVRRAGEESFWLAYQYLPSETRDFLPKVLATILIANSPSQYGFGNVRPAPFLTYDRIRVPASTNLSLVAQAAETSVEYLHFLNPQLRQGISPPEPYVMNVPAGKANDLVKILAPTVSLIDDKKEQKTTGETWQTISTRTGVSVADLMDANPGMITPRGKVFVPVVSVNEALCPIITKQLVKAQGGDTVSAIAKRYGADPDVVAKYNGLLPNSLLGEGREVKIPTSKCSPNQIPR